MGVAIALPNIFLPFTPIVHCTPARDDYPNTSERPQNTPGTISMERKLNTAIATMCAMTSTSDERDFSKVRLAVSAVCHRLLLTTKSSANLIATQMFSQETK